MENQGGSCAKPVLHTRGHGRKCKIIALNSNLASREIRHLPSDKSFSRKRPYLSNSSPVYSTNLTNIPVQKFKQELHRLLKNIPDVPGIPRYTKYRAVPSKFTDELNPIPHARASLRYIQWAEVDEKSRRGVRKLTPPP